ncbi:SDR family oxidoreductase [Mucilaginibacter sp. CSA2-8R]|uniref:SDR family oxidoreductase n=1 Tax=Mucilaginibacter sp. CSA2-8R TaxID=3141542 RepID=UPI00315D8461
MKNNVNGKTIVITGASSGIGRATAKLLANQGAKLVLGARRNNRLQELSDEINKTGGIAVYQQTDVTSRLDVTALVEFAVQTYGGLDVIINNAGISQLQRMEQLDVDGWEQMIDVNLKGTLYGIAAAMPIFKKQGSGHFINVISTAGISIVPTMGVYAGTKNAIRTIGECLRQESEGRWRVTGILPGFVATEFVSNIKNDEIRNTLQSKADQIAMPPEAVADAIAFAIAQPANVDVGDIVIRPTVQG